MQPNTEEIEGPSHSDIGIATEEVLNEEDLLEIQEEPKEVPRSEPDIDAAGCSGWTEGPETPDAEALVVVAGVDIGIFIKGEVRTREKKLLEEVLKGCRYSFLMILPTGCFQILFYVINCQMEKTFIVIG